ncbi:MAG: Na/Pi cotransporter family protein [bacterium]
MIKEMIFGLIGGLALFIYGIQLMGDGLQKTAGDNMRKILGKLTNNPIMGVLVGAGITSVIQSSSATTVMLVGFVNAGLMTLRQAVGVIMGANIGTTVTAQLIAFKIEKYSLPIIGIGFALTFFSKNKRCKNVGEILLGTGILFLGLSTMTGSVKFLRNSSHIKNFFINFSTKPILGVLAGLLVTMFIQSSSATVGLTIALAASGLIGIKEAIPLILGENIGTCVTTLLACVGTNLSAKRAAVAHTLFNILGTILILPFLVPFLKIVLLSSNDVSRQIANAHTLFNIMNTIILLPLISYFIKVVKFIVPGEEPVIELAPHYLDKRLIKTPTIALEQVRNEILRMAKTTQVMINKAIEAFLKEDRIKTKDVHEKEKIVDMLQKEISDYLVELAQESITLEISKKINSSQHMLHDFERIGDHAENIAKLAVKRWDGNLCFTKDASNDLKSLYQEASGFLNQIIQAIEKEDKEIAHKAMVMEENIDKLTREFKNNHIERLNKGICTVISGLVFVDVLNSFEKIGDHTYNIGEAVLGIK